LHRNLNAKLQQAWCQAIENATKALNEILRGFGRAQQILASAAPPVHRFSDLDMFIQNMITSDQSNQYRNRYSMVLVLDYELIKFQPVNYQS